MKQGGLVLTSLALPWNYLFKYSLMIPNKNFDVIIIGGSYSGLAAGMALGRALRNVLIIDSGKPCNRQTPHSHNFITHDGRKPAEIAALAREQVKKYSTVTFLNDLVIDSAKAGSDFEVKTAFGETVRAKKLIFATGIKDILPAIPGMADCWGISVLHCPYCHGYEVRNERTGILANGEAAFELASLISNWTRDLTIFTNGIAALTSAQSAALAKHRINIVQTHIEKLEHTNGYLQRMVFKDGTDHPLKALYIRAPFVQHSEIPQSLGCELTEDGYIRIDTMQRTSVPGVFACGDNTTRMRTVANAVAMGTTTGMMVNKEFVSETF
jgi:thioredoxin reductase